MNTRLPAAAIGLLLLVAALSACSPGAPRASASSSPSDGTVAPDEGSPSEAEPGTLDCASMISAGTVDALTEQGWTAQPKDFVIGDLHVPSEQGMLCFWADYTVASDHGQFYGWATISAEDAGSAQDSLLANGWRREQSDEGVLVTEDPQYAMTTDDEGYGMTYLFGDGWVKFADTRQGLLLIEWTP